MRSPGTYLVPSAYGMPLPLHSHISHPFSPLAGATPLDQCSHWYPRHRTGQDCPWLDLAGDFGGKNLSSQRTDALTNTLN